MTQVLIAQRDNLDLGDAGFLQYRAHGDGRTLHNYDNVMKAVRILHDEHGLNMSMSRITLSTAGLLAGDRAAGARAGHSQSGDFADRRHE